LLQLCVDAVDFRLQFGLAISFGLSVLGFSNRQVSGLKPRCHFLGPLLRFEVLPFGAKNTTPPNAFHARIHRCHPLLVRVTIRAYRPGVSAISNLLDEIQVDIGNIQISDAAGRCAQRAAPTPTPTGPPSNPTHAAQQPAPLLVWSGETFTGLLFALPNESPSVRPPS